MKQTQPSTEVSSAVKALLMLTYIVNVGMVCFALWGPGSVDDRQVRDTLLSLLALAIVIAATGLIYLTPLSKATRPSGTKPKATDAEAASNKSVADSSKSKSSAKGKKPASKKARTYAQITRGKSKQLQTKAIKEAAKKGQKAKLSELVQKKLNITAPESTTVASELIKRAKK